MFSSCKVNFQGFLRECRTDTHDTDVVQEAIDAVLPRLQERVPPEELKALLRNEIEAIMEESLMAEAPAAAVAAMPLANELLSESIMEQEEEAAAGHGDGDENSNDNNDGDNAGGDDASYLADCMLNFMQLDGGGRRLIT